MGQHRDVSDPTGSGATTTCGAAGVCVIVVGRAGHGAVNVADDRSFASVCITRGLSTTATGAVTGFCAGGSSLRIAAAGGCAAGRVSAAGCGCLAGLWVAGSSVSAAVESRADAGRGVCVARGWSAPATGAVTVAWACDPEFSEIPDATVAVSVTAGVAWACGRAAGADAAHRGVTGRCVSAATISSAAGAAVCGGCVLTAAGACSGGVVLQGVCHALRELASLLLGEFLVGVEQSAGSVAQPVVQACAGDLVELAVQAHHPVVCVEYPQIPLGALAQILRCAAISLLRPDPALRGFCELLGTHRLSLRQQLRVASDGLRAGLGDRVSQTPSVGLRHVTGLHRVTQSRHLTQRRGCGDLIMGRPLRQPRSRRQYLGAAVAVTLPPGDQLRGDGLRGVDRGCDASGRGQHPAQFGGGRSTCVDRGQQVGGGCFGSFDGFQNHEQQYRTWV